MQKVCHGPAPMSGHDCLPGPQTVCFPGGRLHERNEEVPHCDRWMAVQVEPTQSEPPTHFPSRLDYCSCLQTLHPTQVIEAPSGPGHCHSHSHCHGHGHGHGVFIVATYPKGQADSRMIPQNDRTYCECDLTMVPTFNQGLGTV